ncbi:unnamed protein product [Mytilus coruscus]|uniref:MEGF10_11 n=1 Tax=Mytilus coruscus TaxID=42192 RepID=A0A6J7ZWL0_MYTCO|nr:unnamed protein product [Mytilus coruscus]
MRLFIITVCPARTYGNECEKECYSNYYGLQCKEMCNCSDGNICNSVQGCIRNNTENCTDPECMSEPKTNMLNDDIDTMSVTSVSSPPDGDSTLSHIQIYLIIVSSTTLLLILIAVASARKVHSACKTNGKTPHHSIRENRKRTTSSRPFPNDMEMRRLPRVPSSDVNRLFQQRSQHQLIEV